MVGDVVSFECDGKDSTKAIIPSEIITLIERMARKNPGSTPQTSPEITGSRHATADIAEEANKTLEREKSKKSSEELVSSERSPSSSPRAPKPPLSAAEHKPQDFYEAQIENAKRMKREIASPPPSSSPRR
jgi:hypothetical protein